MRWTKGDQRAYKAGVVYVDYTELRSWLRRPIQTFRWWRNKRGEVLA